MTRRRWEAMAALSLGFAATTGSIAIWTVPTLFRREKRVWTVVPGRIIRGAWQDPRALQAIIDRERIKTIVTLTAINADDSKYVGQKGVVEQTGVDWVIVPMHGSLGTVQQVAEAADLVADPARQPVFFHCVAGHHRSSQVHAAYLIRYGGYTAAAAWKVVSELPWARPAAKSDLADRQLIEAFARFDASIKARNEISRREGLDDDSPEIAGSTDHPAHRLDRAGGAALRRLGPGES